MPVYCITIYNAENFLENIHLEMKTRTMHAGAGVVLRNTMPPNVITRGH